MSGFILISTAGTRSLLDTLFDEIRSYRKSNHHHSQNHERYFQPMRSPRSFCLNQCLLEQLYLLVFDVNSTFQRVLCEKGLDFLYCSIGSVAVFTPAPQSHSVT